MADLSHTAILKLVRGIRLESPCGGLGSCGGCGVWVQPAANVPSTPHKNISSSKDAEGFRLACQAVPAADITVRLNDRYGYDRKPLDHGDRILLHRGRGTGEIMASEAGLNPQAANGYDVVSRIHYAGTDQRRKEMAALVQDMLNRFIRDACAKASVRAEEIIDICIGANTTMLQMAAGMDCASIGRSPFHFSIKGGGGRTYPASLFGLHVNEAARVYLPPVMHAFVGTDSPPTPQTRLSFAAIPPLRAQPSC